MNKIGINLSCSARISGLNNVKLDYIQDLGSFQMLTLSLLVAVVYLWASHAFRGKKRWEPYKDP